MHHSKDSNMPKGAAAGVERVPKCKRDGAAMGISESPRSPPKPKKVANDNRASHAWQLEHPELISCSGVGRIVQYDAGWRNEAVARELNIWRRQCLVGVRILARFAIM